MKVDWAVLKKAVTNVLAAVWILPGSDVPLSPDPSICNTSACHATAEYLKASMDFTADPCNNFYQYACGHWGENHLRESDYAVDTMHDRMLRNSRDNLAFLKQRNNPKEPKCVRSVRKLFASCLDTDAIDRKGIKPLEDALKRVYLTPNPPLLVSSPNFDLLHTTVEMQRSLGIEMFYSIDIEGRNPYDVMENCISILRPDIHEPPLPTTLSPSVRDAQTPLYDYWIIKQHYIILVFSLLCDKTKARYCDMNNLALAESGWIEKYTSTLNDIKKRPSYSSDQYKLVIYTLKELQKLTNELANEMNATPLDWTRNIRLAFLDLKIQLNDHTPILIEVAYIKDILRFIYKFSPAIHELGIWWTIVDSLAEYSISPLRMAKRKIMDTFVGQVTREAWCENVVNQLYGPVVSYRLNLDNTNYLTKHKVSEMVEDIRRVFMTSVSASSWMDNATKRRAMNKIQSINSFVSFPDSPNYTTDNNFDVYYGNCSLADNFLESALLKIMHDSYFDAKNEGLGMREQIFFLYPPVTVDSFYLLRNNSLVILAGMLAFPLFGYGGLEAMNYASIGSIIGHELAHALDVSGRLFSINGQVEHWWDPQTLRTYRKLEDCFVQAYNTLKVQFKYLGLIGTHASLIICEPVYRNPAQSCETIRRKGSLSGEKIFLFS